MRRIFTVIAVGLYFFAPPVFASETSGFPAGSVWVSKLDAMAGETITIYSAVQNTGGEILEGTVVFLVDGERIGTKRFELESGASELISIDWKTRAGAHTVGAAIEDSSMPVARAESSTLSISVAEPPEQKLEGAAATVASALGSATQTAVPIITEAANNTYEFIESVRLNTAARLENVAKGTSGPSGQVAGASTSSSSSFSGASDIPSGLAQMKQVAASAALVALKSRTIFYPLFLFALLFFLWLLSRWATRNPF